MNKITDHPSIAARFCFDNVTLTLFTDGRMTISHSYQPGPDDVRIPRNFTFVDSPVDYINPRNEFYRFLSLTSTSNQELLTKLSAIGYLLCNRMPRTFDRSKAILCVNEQSSYCATGKSLFLSAVAGYCHSAYADAAESESPFWLSEIKPSTNLLVLDDLPRNTSLLGVFDLFKSTWIIHRKARSPLVIPREKAPYILAATNLPKSKLRKNGSFRRRFCALEFSSYFNAEYRPIDEFGHSLFHDWDCDQWNLFDNFMIYCIRQYIRGYVLGFSLI